jgi:hypothetical protein
LNRFIEDIDTPKQILYLSGFIMSCKDFSPGSDSLLSSIATYLSCKDFSPGSLPLSSSTTGLQFYTNPTRLSPTLSTLLPSYQGSLDRTIDVLDILKWIYYFSGSNLISENVSPESASLFSSAAAHKCYTSSTSGFNLSCKDFSPGFLSPSSTTTVHQIYTNPKWILHSSGFKFSYKDFSPSARPRTMILTQLFNYQGVLNCSFEDIDIPKQILYLSGFNMRCKDFSPGSLPLSSPTTGLQLYTSAAVYKCYTNPSSGFNLSCKDFSSGFLPLSLPTTVHQFYTNPTRSCPTLQTLYLSGFIMSCKDFSPGFSSVNFNCKDFSPGSAPFPPLHISPTSDFNFSCKDFSLGFASLWLLIPNQFYTSSAWFSAILSTLLSNYLGDANFNCKDFFPDPISIPSSIAPQQFHTNGFNFCCKDFSPGLSFSSSLVPPLLLTLYRDSTLLGESCLVLQLRKILTFLNRFTGVINVLMDSLPY